MNEKQKQIKLFVRVAILILLVFLAINVIQLIFINKTKNEIADQKNNISKTSDAIAYYQNQSSSNKDEKNNDVEIVIEGD